MEVLCKDVMHEVWLLMELLAVEILNTDTDFSALFNVESVGNESNVWMHESHELGSNLLDTVSWTEVELDPTDLCLGSDVILDWIVELSLTEEGTSEHINLAVT